MCGIAGFIDSNLKYNKDSSKEILYSMSNKIIHRGPDDSGQWHDNQKGVNLSHRRLSVIDTSQDGTQPMISKSGRYIISYNGEVYNHLQIRKNIEKNKTHNWRSNSDTETLLAVLIVPNFESAILLIARVIFPLDVTGVLPTVNSPAPLSATPTDVTVPELLGVITV